MIPGGIRNPRQMEMMMRRLGMTNEPLEGVEEVLIRLKDTEHVFQAPEVSVLTVQGVRTYQIVGNPEVRPRTTDGSATAAAAPGPRGPPEEDVALVIEQAGVSRDEAIEALAAADGAPAEAILHLLSRRGAPGGE